MLDPKAREKLMALDEKTPSFQEKYEKEKQKMIDKPLTDMQKIGHMAALGFGILLFIGFVFVFLLLGHMTSAGIKFLFLITALMGLCGAIYESFILLKGKMNLRRDKLIELVMVWALTCLFILSMIGYTGYIALSRDPAEGAWMMLIGYLVVVPAVLCTIVYYVREKTLDLKEQLLRMEMQMNKLQEKLFGDENGKDK